MSIKVSKKDIFWGYFAEFFSLASGLITLPLILRLLSPEEIGINYIMLTIGSIVSLFDFGFGSQFGRNVTYVFSGVSSLQKNSVEKKNDLLEINYKLLATMIKTAQFIYRKISFIVLALLLTFGTYYISSITHNFTTVKNLLLIWIIYSSSTFFNIYYTYYMSLLIGKGMIKESRIAVVLSRSTSVIIIFILLYLGFGLIAVAIANLIGPFVSRYLSYRYFFTEDLKSKIDSFIVAKSEIKELFEVIWHNARKIGLISVAASSLTYLTTFIVGSFLSLSDVASFGLMIQITGLICIVSMSLFNSMLPNISYLYLNKDENGFKNKVALSIIVFYIIFFIGAIGLIYIAPYFLETLGSKITLPCRYVLIIFLCFNFFEKNQALFSQILLLENKVPFMKAAIFTGLLATLGVFLVLYLKMGILEVVIVQAIPTLAYSAWKWPLLTFRKFNLSFYDDIILRGVSQLKNIRNY